LTAQPALDRRYHLYRDHRRLRLSGGDSRRLVAARDGYAISRSTDARLALAALKAAIRTPNPPEGCVHHSDRGSQHASEVYRQLLADNGLVGSMSRRGNPYDNAQAQSFMKTSNVEAVY